MPQQPVDCAVLIKPMLDGDKLMARPASPSRDDAPARLKALIVLAICGALVAGMVRFSG